MRSRNTPLAMLVPLAVAALVLAPSGASAAPAGAAAEAGEFVHPVLRVPEMPAAPSVDGTVGDDEWRGAAVFTGVCGNPLGAPFLLPQAQQVTWYLGFRGPMIYLAMKSPHPPGTYPSGRTKEMDDPDVLWGDHVEVEITPNARTEVKVPGKGFYLMVINAWGAMNDRHLFNGTPGTEDLWSTGGEVKCSVSTDLWQMEMSIDARRMNVQKLDGRDLTMQLVRTDSPSGGIFFAGWRGASWMSWEKFAQTDYDSSAPVFQLVRLGEVAAGDLDAEIRLTGVGRARDVTVEVAVEDADGKRIYAESRTEPVAPGRTAALRFQKAGLPVTDLEIADSRRNHLEVRATYKDGAAVRTLYWNRSPFMKLTPAWRAKFLDPWLSARPQAGKWEAVFANLPYAGKALAKVDVDFFGIAEKVRSARRFTVAVAAEGRAKPLQTAEAPISERGAGEVLFDLPDLPDGKYQALFKLFGPDQTVADERTVDFVRKRYPWEHNKLGISDEVIPPFSPVEVNPKSIVGRPGGGKVAIPRSQQGDTTVGVWGRLYLLGASTLPEQIWAVAPTGTFGRLEPLLAAPVRLELMAAKKTVAGTPGALRVVSSVPTRADVEGAVSLGPVAVRTRSFIEYDGWQQVELVLTPEGNPQVDALDLVVDLRDEPAGRASMPLPCDTLYAQRLGMNRDSFYGGIPEKPGMHFVSTSLTPPTGRGGPADIAKDWRSFVPIVYAGSGDRGLWLFFWSDAGWTLSDKDPAVRVERLADRTVRVRVRFISGPATLDAPRTIRFALQAAPVKPNDPEYRTRLERIFHDTSGYRYYGDSVDSFVLPADEDYEALRRFILYGPLNRPESKVYQHWTGRAEEIRSGKVDRIMLYGSQWMTGLGAEEFDTFGGEWLGRTNWTPRPDVKFSGRWNYGGTIEWKTPRQLTPSRVNWPRSFLDFFLYYNDRLIDKAGINGTWWDNCYGGFVTEYDPELGRLDAKWNLIYRRDLCKRLNVIGWRRMRPPCWSLNTEVEVPWCQVYWMVEGDWDQGAPGTPALKAFNSLGWFRATTRTKSTVMVTKPSYIGRFKGLTPESDRLAKRSADALMLAHDLPPVFCRETVHQLEAVVDYSNTADCLFLGYWSSSPWVQPATPAVYASVYQNTKRRAAVIVFGNSSDRDVALGGTALMPGIAVGETRPVDVRRVYDLETGESVKTGFRDGWTVVDEPLVLPAWDYRVVAIELK